MVRTLSLAAFAAALALSAPRAAAQCVSNGPGGFVPAPGAQNGAWPNVLPTGSLFSTQPVTVPAGASVIHSVKFALKHTFAGDVQLVLISPSGTAYNLLQTNDGVAGGGCASDFFGVYELVDPAAGLQCLPVTPLPCGTPQIAPGTYLQQFGAWPHGAAGVLNTPLERIPLASGNWTLALHDWFVGSDNGALLNWELCFGAPTPPPPTSANPQQCTLSAPGGAFPAGGTSGTWPGTLPSSPLVAPLVIQVPASASRIERVRIDGLQHTWLGDVQLVLESPTGARFNLLQTNDGAIGGGCPADLAGDYVFVDALAGQDPCGNPLFWPACPGALLPPGMYAQSFGAWPAGTGGIQNVPLHQIPLASGTWQLLAYDWFVPADFGDVLSWSVCFDVAGTPASFCTPQAPGTSSGCLPQIDASAYPSVSGASSCTVTISSVEGARTGLVFYGVNGQLATPWCASSSNFLCVKTPIQRTETSTTGGTAGACDGQIVLDWDLWQATHAGALGQPWNAGAHAWLQGWFRDPPACKTTSLSEGVELVWQP